MGQSNQLSGSMSSGSYASGNSGMSGMNRHANQISGSMSSGDYVRGSSGMSGMSHQSNEMSGSYVSGNSGMNHYSSGSAQRNMHPSTGTGSQRSLNMRSSSLSSGSQSVPEIGYLEEEFSEVENSNTVFIQNHGSAGNNGMQNHGSSGSYGMQNQGR